MLATRWQPFGDVWSEMNRLHDEMNRMFDRFGLGDGMRRVAPSYPALNLWQDEDNLYVEAELPGVKPEDVEITLEGSILTIRGEKKDPHQGQTTDYHLRERRYGRFARSFQLPSTVDESKVTANLKATMLFQ